MNLDYKGREKRIEERKERKRGWREEWGREGKRKKIEEGIERGGRKCYAVWECVFNSSKTYALFQSGCMFSPAMYGRYRFSPSFLVFGAINIFYFRQSDSCVVIADSDFNFHFSKGTQWWISFHVFIWYPYSFFGEVSNRFAYFLIGLFSFLLLTL